MVRKILQSRTPGTRTFKIPFFVSKADKEGLHQFVTPEMVDMIQCAESSSTIPTYNAIRLTCRRKGVNMDMRFCRKIFASWLHKHCVSDVLIDLLQGRVGKSILVNHYLQPGQDYRYQVLDAVNSLRQKIGRS